MIRFFFFSGSKEGRNFHVVLNPKGGKGLAKKAWETCVKPVLDAAGSSYTISRKLSKFPLFPRFFPLKNLLTLERLDTGPPGSPSHAYQLGLKHEPREFDALMSLSGDGIVHELLNGLASQPGKGRKVLRETCVVHVPCGSGNALATSIVGNERVGDWMWNTLVGIKGTVSLTLFTLLRKSCC